MCSMATLLRRRDDLDARGSVGVEDYRLAVYAVQRSLDLAFFSASVRGRRATRPCP